MQLAATWMPVANFEGRRFAYVGTGGADVIGKVYADPGTAGTRTMVPTTGNRLPYAPEAMLTATFGLRHRSGAELRVEAVMVSAQFTDPVNTRVLVPDGQQGPIAASTLWNLTVNAPLFGTGARGWVVVRNLADQTFVVDRSRGLLPGMPRLLQAGMSRSF